jgi:hypothetical protein
MKFLDNMQDKLATGYLGGMLGVNPATAAGYEAKALQGFSPEDLKEWGGAQKGVASLVEPQDFGSAVVDASAAADKTYRSAMAGALRQPALYQSQGVLALPQRQPVQAMNPYANTQRGV